MTPTAPAVTLRGVTKQFDDLVAVHTLDLQIADGEFFSLLGPSGCGKTTTLRMIAGLDFPTSGSISIFGEDMGLRPPNKRPVNTVFQSYALFPHMTVYDNVAFGLQMRKLPRDEVRRRVTATLGLVQLAEQQQRRPRHLSGGQQQRVALARALVNEPRVLLLDEPLGALDLKLRQSMQMELKELQSRVGITFVYVTHDQDEALTMSDRIGVMDRGRLLQVGTPAEIYEHPCSRVVADFIGDTNMLHVTARRDGHMVLGPGQVVRADVDVPAGRAAVLALRPERLQLFAANERVDSGSNALDATVVRRMYLGNAIAYDVDAAGATLRVRQRNAPGHRTFAVGDDVQVAWTTDAAVLVED